MSWLDKIIPATIGRPETQDRRASVPEGLWKKCPACNAVLYSAELENSLNVCPKCNHHMRIGARQRLALFLDAEHRQEIGENLSPSIPWDSRTVRNIRIVSQARRKQPVRKMH